jgi:hypothetical protein
MHRFAVDERQLLPTISREPGTDRRRHEVDPLGVQVPKPGDHSLALGSRPSKHHVTRPLRIALPTTFERFLASHSHSVASRRTAALRNSPRFYALPMGTDALLARLQVLEDERAILQTLYQYGHAMDYGPDADFVDCFTPDAVWDVRMRKNPGGGFACVGHGAIAASLEAQTSVRAPALYAKHLLIEPRIMLNGDEASVQSYFLRTEPRDDGPTQIVASGRYLDTLMRCEDGRWRITQRIAEIDDM